MLEFNGKQIKIELNYNTMCAMEDMGISLQDLESKPFNLIRFLVFNALKKQDKKITIEKAGDEMAEYLSNGGSLELLGDAISKAVENSGFFPKNNK